MKTLCLVLLMVVLCVALLVTFLKDRARLSYREIFNKWKQQFDSWQMMR